MCFFPAGGSPEGGEADLAAQGVSKHPVTNKVLKHNYMSLSNVTFHFLRLAFFVIN